MLIAYMDESGHSDDTDFVGMAGLVAPSVRWETFEREWGHTPKEAGISSFHMREFAHSVGEFRKWKENEPKRKELLAKLMAVVSRTNAVAIGAIVSRADFRTLKPDRQLKFLDPYYACFQTCAWGAARLASFGPPDEKVAMVFGDHSEFKGRAERLWRAMKRYLDLGAKMESYTFSDARRVVPLQAADIVAYELRQHFDNRLNRPDLKPRWAFTQILKGHPLFLYFDRALLLWALRE